MKSKKPYDTEQIFTKLNESVKRSSEDKEDTMKKIRMSSTNKTTFPIKPLMALTACVMLFGVILVSFLESNTDHPNNLLAAEVSDYLERDVFIPAFRDQEIVFLGVSNNRIHINYADDVEEGLPNNEIVSHWENQPNSKLFKAPSNIHAPITIDLTIMYGSMTFSGMKSRTIQDIEVKYELLERPEKDILAISFIYNDTIYDTKFFLDESISQEVAFQLTEELIISLSE